MFRLLRTALLASACIFLPTIALTTPTICNNSPGLCSKAYNNVTFLGAHDSPFLRNEATGYSTSGNQYYNTTVQLDAGVRLLTAQIHKYNNTNTGATEWHLCHSSCLLLDAGTLSSWLTEIKTWMDGNPNDVVTVLLVNSDGATAKQIGTEFTSSGITEYAYTPSVSAATASWPTLGNLISNNTRLVTFVASLSSNADAPYLMDEFTYVFENSYENTNASSFSCNPDRPSSLANSPSAALQSNRLFLMNHFLYETQAFGIQTPDAVNIQSTNSVSNGIGALGTRMSACASVYGVMPNFVLVDFFNVGPAIASVDSANSVGTPVNRKSVSTAQLVKSSTSDGTELHRSRQSLFAVVVGMMLWICVL